MVKDFWCPKCGKKGLHPYNKKDERPEKTDDIEYLWCLHCNYKIESKPKKENELIKERLKEVANGEVLTTEEFKKKLVEWINMTPQERFRTTISKTK